MCFMPGPYVDSEVDWELAEWQIPEGYNQWHRVQLGAITTVSPKIQNCLTYSSMIWMNGEKPPQQVPWWHKAVRSGQYPRGPCSPSEGSQQVGEIGRENSFKINKGKCRVLSLGRNNQHRLGLLCSDAALQRRTWGCWWTTSCPWAGSALVAKKASGVLGCIRMNIASRSKEVFWSANASYISGHSVLNSPCINNNGGQFPLLTLPHSYSPTYDVSTPESCAVSKR